MSRYPVTSALAGDLAEVAEDSRSLEEHIKAMKEEMSKQRLRSSLLALFMKSTHKDRRNFILYDIVPVATVIDKYPALSQRAMVNK